MPVKIPHNLPAKQILLNENIFVMSEKRALSQDIRPLKIIILNLMPNKIDTETQLLRLLSNSPLQIEVSFLHTVTYTSKNVNPMHLTDFYTSFNEIKHLKFDGLLITGAPLGLIDYEHVNYWKEFTEIVAWSKYNVQSTFYLCWAAHAGLYYNYSINKYPLEHKLFGIFPHKVDVKYNPLTRGYDDAFMVPHSRHSYIKHEDIKKQPKLQILASSEIAGPYLIATANGREVYITGHSEYEGDRLKKEYERDITTGRITELPVNYFPDNNPSKTPIVSWRAHASLLFSNWLDYCVYQETPYDISQLKYNIV
jgi:homoserine O-succinyltransferase